MKLEITEKKQNPLINRLEVKGIVEYEGQATPSNAVVQEALAKALRVEKDLLVLSGLHTIHGQQRGIVEAICYSTAEVKQKYFITTAHLRKKEAEAQKKAAEGQ